MEDQRVRKEVNKKDLGFFCGYYLLNHFRQAVVTDIHKEWLKNAHKGNNMIIAAPRSHAKSTVFSLAYPLHQILYGEKKYILLISDTIQQATSLLGDIVEELETNERILNDFGNIAGYTPLQSEDKKKWTQKEVITTTGVKIQAGSWTTKLRGLKHGSFRPDLIILDDVENDILVNSKDQREKVKNIFFKSILNLGTQTTQTIVVGTILHFDSLLSYLLDNPPLEFYPYKYRAIENGKALIPEIWSLEELEKKKRQIGSIAFEQEFMNNPLDEEHQLIKPQKFYDYINLKDCVCYGYIDPAISEKETSDYTALVTVAKHRDSGKLYIVEPVRIRGGLKETAQLIFSMHEKYNYEFFGIETIAYQKALFQYIQMESEKNGIYLPIIEIKNDKDKVRRYIEISPHIENGTVSFPKGYEDFNSELIQFPKSAHDDLVDAFIGAVKLALSFDWAVVG